jgi:hypothetical protein
MNSSKGQRTQAASARAQLAAERERRLRRRRRLIVVVLPVAVVLVAVGALVAARLAGFGSGKPAPSASGTDAGVISAVTSVPAAVLDQVGVGSVTVKPTPVDAPALTDKGLPRVLYVGAEYCPYCAAERWPMVVALSRFGSFTGLGQTTSAADDVFPSTPTLTFHGSTFSSQALAFTGVETQGNQKVNGEYPPLDSMSAADQQLFSTYDGPPYFDERGSIPFVDIGGKYLISGASYSPQVLQGKTHEEIGAALNDPSSDVAQAVDGAANVITAAICATTKNQPTAVCSSAGVQAAAKQLS